jgi:polyhydroxybutyrate depolymerase
MANHLSLNMFKNLLSAILCFLTLGSYAQTTITDSITSGGITRYYQVYVPAAYDGSEAVPLVLNLHGYGSFAFQQMFYGEFRPIADTANFILLVPDGTVDGFGFQHWNTFGPFGIGVDDVAFIDNLLDSISAEYSIDANRIYSTGMSNGGFMSYELACHLSHRIAAIASVTGTIDVDHFDFCSPTHPMPVMEIHGTADLTVPYEGNDDFMPVSDVLSYWADYNACNPEPEVTLVDDISPGDGSTAEHIVYSGGFNDANVEHFKIINGGHTWPGTILLLPGAGSTNKDINASLEIWKFFSRYQLDVLTKTEEVLSYDNSLYVFPNPVTDQLNFQLPTELINQTIQVFDMNGQLLVSISQAKTSNSIGVQQFPDGLYILQCGHLRAPFLVAH